MTREKYIALFEKARRESAALSLKARFQVKLAYQRASEGVARSLESALSKELSPITLMAQAQLLAELSSHAEKLSGEIGRITSQAMSRAAEIGVTPDAEYLTGVFASIDDFQFGAGTVKSVYSRVNSRAVANAVARVTADGYDLSKRVWNLKGDYEEAIKNIITSGIASGRDPVKLARDIQLYTVNGKVSLANRWGALERGSAEWKARIKGTIDYRAQRLVRSEIQATLQSVAIEAGRANPGTTGEFDWVLGPGLSHCAECIDNSARRYSAADVPDYPHPNCGCQVRPVLMDRKKFVEDLKSWRDGVVDDENGYIDEWAQRYTQSA